MDPTLNHYQKTDASQNSVLEKQILHKIQHQKNGLFTKFIMKKQTFYKIHYQKNGLITKFSIYRHKSLTHFL